MIGKINPNPTADFRPLVPSPTSRALEDPDFKSILEERLADSKPLELIMIEFLSRTIEQFLSRTTDQEDALFIAPPFSFNRPVVPFPQRNQQTLQNQEILQNRQIPQVDSQPVPEASNNLRERKDQDYRDQGYDDMIEQASQKYGVEPALIKAVIAAESGGNPNALSPAGAQGMMQLMPRTAAELGVINPFDPVENIMAGTRYLRHLLDRYLGNTRLALAAYNWGMGNLEKRPDAMPKETKNYIIKVESLYRTHMAASL
jgi:hypothetical protein